MKLEKKENMPFEKIKYCCEHCQMEHDDYNDALNCEALGIPEDELEIGQEVNFNEENQMMSRWSYSGNTGIVKESKIISGQDPQTGEVSHYRAYLVHCSMGADITSQVAVRGIVKDTEGNGWVSPYNMYFGTAPADLQTENIEH